MGGNSCASGASTPPAAVSACSEQPTRCVLCVWITQRAGAAVVEDLGGALDRTMTALEPYLMQLRIEMGAANA